MINSNPLFAKIEIFNPKKHLFFASAFLLYPGFSTQRG